MISLLEANEDDKLIFNSLMHVIDPKIIKKAFRKEAYFRTNYSAGIDFDVFFQYYKYDKVKINPIIIEIGFNIYFLLRKMQ